MREKGDRRQDETGRKGERENGRKGEREKRKNGEWVNPPVEEQVLEFRM